MKAFTYTRTSMVIEATHINTMSAVMMVEPLDSLGLSNPGFRLDRESIAVADVNSRRGK